MVSWSLTLGILLRWFASDAQEAIGRQLAAKHEWKGCGEMMLAAAQRPPQHPRREVRLVEAAQCLQKAGLVGQATGLRVQLLRENPHSPFARDALFEVAAAYHRLAYYSKATECYGLFATAFPHDKRAALAIANINEFSAAVNGKSDDCIEGVRAGELGEIR